MIKCCDYLELFKEIPDESIGLALTDPPYGINYSNNYTSKPHEVLKGDEGKFSYLALGKELYRVLKNNTAIFIFTGWSEYPEHYKQIESCGFSMKEPLICQKRASGKTDLYGSFQSNSDWVIFAHKGSFKFRATELVKNKRAGTIPNKGRKPVPLYKTRFPSCWFGEEYPYSSENPSFQKKYDIYHPTIKSLDFCKTVIQLASDDGDTVIDPFMGSGTTVVACKELNRNCFACDIEECFYNLTLKRLNDKEN